MNPSIQAAAEKYANASADQEPFLTDCKNDFIAGHTYTMEAYGIEEMAKEIY